MSVLEIWGAEYQENDCLLIRPESRALLEGVCARERCLMQVRVRRACCACCGVVLCVGVVFGEGCWRVCGLPGGGLFVCLRAMCGVLRARALRRALSASR